MRFQIPARLLLASATAMLLTTACNTTVQADENQDNLGYFLGYTIGQSFKNQGFRDGDFSFTAMQEGISDAMAGEKPKLNNEKLSETQGRIQAMLQKRAQERQAERAAAVKTNLEKSTKWLAENAKKPGIQKLPSGVQYKVVKEGTGGSPSASDTVRVHYTGRLIGGQVFDTSLNGEPAEFSVGEVIPGWRDSLQKMKVGSKWLLFVPPAQAYAEQGRGDRIGPNEALIFEVELLDIL